MLRREEIGRKTKVTDCKLKREALISSFSTSGKRPMTDLRQGTKKDIKLKRADSTLLPGSTN